MRHNVGFRFSHVIIYFRLKLRGFWFGKYFKYYSFTLKYKVEWIGLKPVSEEGQGRFDPIRPRMIRT